MSDLDAMLSRWEARLAARETGESLEQSPDSLLARIRALATRKDQPSVREVTALAGEFYGHDGNGAGGSLHIVLDDGNVEDHSVQFCREYAGKEGDALGAAMADLLMRLSPAMRYRVYERIPFSAAPYSLRRGSE